MRRYMKTDKESKPEKIQVWGGIECTINRVQDNYYDQLELSGHYARTEDINLFAELGIKALRYPVLWERHQPVQNQEIDWSLIEGNLNKIRELNIKPIAGLIHHGSGPSYAHMEEASFVDGLARYAGLVAEKFPWIEYYTPVNEPLTTARFCGLYGFWHPHGKSDQSFARILINECKATVLAMKEIRKVNPDAKLVQTEDLAKIYSTDLLKYQADFENERRWITFDLLCGKLTKEKRMYSYLISAGISEEELQFFIDNPCPPAYLGVNYYVTSERFLDENTEGYPPAVVGGNGRHRYADVEVVRVKFPGETGPKILLKELWERFQLPIAITEVQLSCTREQQLRWMKYIWDAATSAKEEGVNIQAITSWSLLGAFGWNHLLTQNHHEYEIGVFDVRSLKPRPTALVKMIKTLANGEEYNHPLVIDEGWWKKDSRLLYFPYKDKENKASYTELPTLTKVKFQPVLIIGKNGTLGKAFGRICEERGICYQLLSRQEMNICDANSIETVIKETNPCAIVNAAGYVRVDDAEKEQEKCYLDNTVGPITLSLMCKKYGVKLLTFSSDMVFDGKKGEAYVESDVVIPLNTYGISKAKAENVLLDINSEVLIIRTSAFFGPWDDYNFIRTSLNGIRNGKEIKVVSDVYVSPTYVPDLVNICLDLMIDEAEGVWHVANNGQITWADLALEAAERAGENKKLIIPTLLSELNFPAVRPNYSVLKSERGIILPTLENALDRFFADVSYTTIY